MINIKKETIILILGATILILLFGRWSILGIMLLCVIVESVREHKEEVKKQNGQKTI